VRAVHVGVAGESEGSAVPAVGEDDANGVGAGAQQRGDVVGLHLQGGVVAGGAGGELLVAYPLAVEEQLVDAVGRGVGAGEGGRGVQGESLAEGKAGALSRGSNNGFLRADPLRHPV
jgi:hypothetical protein